MAEYCSSDRRADNDKDREDGEHSTGIAEEEGKRESEARGYVSSSAVRRDRDETSAANGGGEAVRSVGSPRGLAASPLPKDQAIPRPLHLTRSSRQMEIHGPWFRRLDP